MKMMYLNFEQIQWKLEITLKLAQQKQKIQKIDWFLFAAADSIRRA